MKTSMAIVTCVMQVERNRVPVCRGSERALGLRDVFTNQALMCRFGCLI